MFAASAGELDIGRGVVFDGNKNANASACNLLTIRSGVTASRIDGVRFTGAPSKNGFGRGGGYGSGLVYAKTGAAAGLHTVRNCEIDACDSAGFVALSATGITLDSNVIHDNGHHGAVLNNNDKGSASKIRRCSITDNYVYGNGASGIAVGDYIEDDVPQNFSYGPDDPEAVEVIVSGNHAYDNPNGYGIAVYGDHIHLTGNNVSGNQNGIQFTVRGGHLQQQHRHPQRYLRNRYGVGRRTRWSPITSAATTAPALTRASLRCGVFANILTGNAGAAVNLSGADSASQSILGGNRSVDFICASTAITEQCHHISAVWGRHLYP
jgi:hypothetical protein